jgi:hypothetical protein
MKRRSDNESKETRTIYTRYEYREIGNIEGETQEAVNFYGVVIDACFPYKVDEKKYMCYLKVVDPTYCIMEEQDNFAIVSLQARRFEDLPIIQRCGDIIRIHRAEYNYKEDQAYFKLNMSYSSSWSVFSADDQVAPEVNAEEDWTYKAYAFSGKQYTFEGHDQKLLKSIRKWNKDYMTNNLVIIKEMYTPLNQAAEEEGDFNVVARITQIVQRDSYTSDIRLKDQSKATWFLTVSRRKFPRLQEGSVVKIRSASIDTETERERCLELAPHSNIMTFVPFSMLNNKMMSEISMNPDKVDKELFKKPILTEPVLATRTFGDYSKLPLTTLSEMFDSSNSEETIFRTRFYVVKMTPDNSEDFIEMHVPKSSKATPSMKAKAKGESAYKVQFLAKDPSTAIDDFLYKIYLYSHNGLGREFFPNVDLLNCSRVNQAQININALQKFQQTLLKFNVHVEAVVEKVMNNKSASFFIRDTIMKF